MQYVAWLLFILVGLTTWNWLVERYPDTKYGWLLGASFWLLSVIIPAALVALLFGGPFR